MLALITILITVRLEIPINMAVASWTAGSAPSEWMVVRERWLHNHLARTLIGLAAFLFASIGLARS